MSYFFAHSRVHGLAVQSDDGGVITVQGYASVVERFLELKKQNIQLNDTMNRNVLAYLRMPQVVL